MKLGLETFSYHLAFAYQKMTVFDFITRTADLGLDGVQINIEGEDWGHLGGSDPGYLSEVRQLVEEKDLYIELDTYGTDPEHLVAAIDVCHQLGADRLRTYSSFGGNVSQELEKARVDLPKVMPLCERWGVKIAFENHEYESSHDVNTLIQAIDSPWLGAHIDNGNAMMVWEEPLEAVQNMAPFAASTHFKDHLLIRVGDAVMIAGVPLGKGSIDLPACYDILARSSALARINIEVCYGYLAPFRRPQTNGCGATLGTGSFKIAEPPYAAQVVAPYLLDAIEEGLGLESYAWQNLAQSASHRKDKDRLLEYQDQAVVESVQWVKQIRDRYAG